MERKRFIVAATTFGAAMAAGAASQAASTVIAAATPFPGYSAPPTPYPQSSLHPRPVRTRGEYRSDRNLRHVFHHLDRLIDELGHDTHDYCGHRAQAISYLQQARDQLQAGLSCDEQH